MPNLVLKIVVLPTYDVGSINVADASTYAVSPTNPILLATPPGFNPISITFTVSGNNILTSDVLGITETGVMQPLPDGIYRFSYSINPSNVNFTNISIMRVDVLQEKFDNVFMTLDMMECDKAIKEQSKVNLNTIYLLIQGAVAAGNNYAETEAYKLYQKASDMLDSMLKKNCGCSGTNYLVNYK